MRLAQRVAAWLACAWLVATAVGGLAAASPGTPTAGPSPVPPVDWTALPEVADRSPLARTEHFRVHVEPPGDPWLEAMAHDWAPRLEGILASDERRYRSRLERVVDIVFQRAYAARCPARGLAAPYEEPPLTVVYVDERSDEAHVRGVLAHEIGHHLCVTEAWVADGVLSEGLANWIGQDAVLAWRGWSSWDAVARNALLEGTYASLMDEDALSPSPGEDCIERRDRVYALRTSFVAWLIDGWGLDTVRAMPYRESRETGEGGEEVVVREVDYVAATGHDLATLERMWLEAVLFEGGIETLFVRGPATGREARDG